MPPTSQTAKPVTIEVIDDPLQIEAARRAIALRRDQRFAELLSNPAIIYSYEAEDMALLRARQEKAVAALSALRDDATKSGETRVQAIIALHLLDVPTSAEQFAELASRDTPAKLALLHRMNDLFTAEAPPPAPIRQLIIDCVDDSDTAVLRAAVTLAAQYKIDEAGDQILARIDGSAGSDRDALLNAAAILRPTRQVIDLLVAQLAVDPGPFGAPAALGSLAEAAKTTTDVDARRTAVAAISEYLMAQPDQPWIDGGTITAIGALAQLPPPEGANTLVKLARGIKWRAVQHSVLGELANLDVNLARKVAQETGTPLEVAQPIASATKPAVPMERNLEQIADICARRGVMDRSEADHVLARMRETTFTVSPEEDYSPADSVSGFLYAADRFYEFDTETGMVPNRHDLLIVEMANKSAGRFKPDAVLETYTTDDPDAETGKYEVQFIHAGRLYRFQPVDLGDWYDVGAILTATNRALADAGESQRFVLLDTNDQMARVIFANPLAVSRAAAELDLELSDDPGAARRQGKEFEEQVLQSFPQD